MNNYLLRRHAYSCPSPNKREGYGSSGHSNFLLQSLGFVRNLRKYLMIPLPKIEFVRVIINSKEMTNPLTPEKLSTIKLMCVNLLKNPQTTISELAKL